METIRVLLADDHDVLRAGVRAVLANESDLILIGEARTGDEAQHLCLQLHPDVLLLDLSMPGPNATATVHALRGRSSVRVVILTAYHDRPTIQKLVRAGIAGYVLKDDPVNAISQSIRAAHYGGSWFSPDILTEMVEIEDTDGVDASRMKTLTVRDWQLLRFLVQGRDNARIGEEISLSRQSVRNYLSQLYKKIGVTSRIEAVLWAQQHDIGDGEPSGRGTVSR